MHFGQLEVLECLWPRGTSEPEYTEVRAESECVCGKACRYKWVWRLNLTFVSCIPSQILSFPSSLGSQASARPCAHLCHTQTLRRMSRVIHPLLCLTFGYFPWYIYPSPRLSLCWYLPVPTSFPLCLCSR